jgi:hypothetical protein
MRLRDAAPLSRYTVDCGDLKESECEQETKQFESERRNNLRSSNAELRQAAEAFGEFNDDNGIIVKFSKLDKVDGVTSVEGLRPLSNDRFGIRATVTFDTRPDGTRLQAIVAHEGRHLLDALLFAASVKGDGSYNASLNLTQYQLEVNAFLVSQAVYQTSNQKSGSFCPTSANCVLGAGVRNPRAVINQILADPNAGYNLTPQNPGTKQFPPFK